MALNKEIWTNDIVEKLYKDNAFLNYCFNSDQYVLAGKVVHRPQAGVAPKVVKNRTDLPAKVTRRSDTEVTYVLDEYTSDPIHISNAEEVELSYDKRDSVLSDSENAINETVADEMLLKWTPTKAERKTRTTGVAKAATAASATGKRRAVTVMDISRIQGIMNKQKAPKTERYAILPSDMYQQLVEDMTTQQLAGFSACADAAKGIVGQFYGFTFLERATVVTTDADGNVKQTADEPAATDCEAGLFWQKNSVERAMGEVKFFENTDDPTYYGDIYSALIRMGGRVRREDEAGLVMLFQDTVADSDPAPASNEGGPAVQSVSANGKVLTGAAAKAAADKAAKEAALKEGSAEGQGEN